MRPVSKIWERSRLATWPTLFCSTAIRSPIKNVENISAVISRGKVVDIEKLPLDPVFDLPL